MSAGVRGFRRDRWHAANYPPRPPAPVGDYCEWPRDRGVILERRSHAGAILRLHRIAQYIRRDDGSFVAWAVCLRTGWETVAVREPLDRAALPRNPKACPACWEAEP